MRNKPIIVQKYGGACLETPAKIRAVASSLADLHSRGHRVVAIVSAMGKTTDELVRMAYQVSPHPNRRELDMLLTTGERISMSLMSMALSDLGVPAISFTGSQAGVMTDDSHSSARILDVRPIRVREELDRGRIVVLAGFQGVNPVTKEITTLGRGGSDTTAVAMAAALKAECCEIIKEVDGVCSADPHIVANSKPLRQLDFASLSEMCFWGAKVLHFRSVELAQSQNVPLVLKKSGGAEYSTQVMKEVDGHGKRKSSGRQLDGAHRACGDRFGGSQSGFREIRAASQATRPVLAATPRLGFHRRKNPHHDDVAIRSCSTLCCARWKGARTCANSVRL